MASASRLLPLGTRQYAVLDRARELLRTGEDLRGRDEATLVGQGRRAALQRFARPLKRSA